MDISRDDEGSVTGREEGGARGDNGEQWWVENNIKSSVYIFELFCILVHVNGDH